MIEYPCAPGDRVVAVFAGFGGRDMGIVFTDGVNVVVTALATVGNVAVVEPDVTPGLV